MRRTRPVWWIAGLSVAYWLIAAAAPFYFIIQLLNGAYLGVTTAILFGYGKPAWRAFIDKPDEPDQLILGVALSWIATAIQRAWLAGWRAADEPYWMLNSRTWGFLLVLQLIGGILHLTAPNTINGQVPARYWVKFGAIVGTFLALAWIIIVASLPGLRN